MLQTWIDSSTSSRRITDCSSPLIVIVSMFSFDFALFIYYLLSLEWMPSSLTIFRMFMSSSRLIYPFVYMYIYIYIFFYLSIITQTYFYDCNKVIQEKANQEDVKSKVGHGQACGSWSPRGSWGSRGSWGFRDVWGSRGSWSSWSSWVHLFLNFWPLMYLTVFICLNINQLALRHISKASNDYIKNS